MRVYMEKQLDEKNAEVLDEKYLHVKTTYPKFFVVVFIFH